MIEDKIVHFQHQPEWEDVRETLHFATTRRSGKRPFAVRLILAIAAVIAITILIIEFSRPVDKGVHRTESWPVTLAAGYLLLLILLGKLDQLWMAMIRTGWISAGPSTKYCVGMNGIHIERRGRQRNIPWDEFERWIESPSAYILIEKTGDVIRLAKDAIDDVAVATLREILSESVSLRESSVVDKPSTASVANFSQAICPLPTEQIKSDDRRAAVGLTVSLLSPLILLGVITTSKHIARHAATPWIASGIGFLILFVYCWTCAQIARSRGFTPWHGILVGLFFPPAGAVFLVSRSHPVPFETIDRSTLRGLISTPMAKQSDLSSWGK